MTDSDYRRAEHAETSAPADDAQGKRGRSWPWLLPAVLGGVLVILCGASAWLYWGAAPSLDEAPVAVARQEAQNFFTLDYTHADVDLARVLDLAADPFKQQFGAQQNAVKGGLVEKKLSMSAAIPDNGAAVEYQRGDTTQVLVAVNATTKDATGASQLNRYRARVQLNRLDGQWRVTQFDQVG